MNQSIVTLTVGKSVIADNDRVEYDETTTEIPVTDEYLMPIIDLIIDIV